MVKNCEDNFILPPPEFREWVQPSPKTKDLKPILKPTPAPRTKTLVEEKRVPAPRIKFDQSKAIKGYT